MTCHFSLVTVHVLFILCIYAKLHPVLDNTSPHDSWSTGRKLLLPQTCAITTLLGYWPPQYAMLFTSLIGSDSTSHHSDITRIRYFKRESTLTGRGTPVGIVSICLCRRLYNFSNGRQEFWLECKTRTGDRPRITQWIQFPAKPFGQLGKLLSVPSSPGVLQYAKLLSFPRFPGVPQYAKLPSFHSSPGALQYAKLLSFHSSPGVLQYVF